MEFITIVIARLIGDAPMVADDWIKFRYDVVSAMRKLVKATGTGVEWLEISSGTTVWQSREEDCVTVTLMNTSRSLVPAIKEALAPLPARYGQDAIGVRYGVADLVTPDMQKRPDLPEEVGELCFWVRTASRRYDQPR